MGKVLPFLLLILNKIVVGYTDGTFGPSRSMTRAEAAAIFARLLAEKNGDTISTAANTKFADIPAHAWYSGYVKYLSNNGITYGKSKTIFAPSDAITRAEFTTMAVRFFDVYGDGDAEIMEQFGGFNDVSSGYWAAEYIKYAALHGWINGYGGKFYVVGSGRQALQKNKTQTEDYYLLTLAAIAKELSFRHAEPATEIHLAAGLPLTSFGREKNAFREYLLRDGKTVNFRYEGQEYSIAIRKVSLFPQGYAAVLTQSILLDEPSVIVADIGGWTVDLMRLDNRIPNASTCRSLELGMIRCLDEIGEQIRRTLGLSMTAAQMESVLRGDAVHINEDARKIIDRQADAYVHRLLSAITESGLDTRAMPAVFLGGGAALLKRTVSAADGLCRPVILDDVSLNAKGYERLAERLTKNDEQ